eukprot:5195705-Ditylum_brightwellii.AAC.1
MYPRKPLKEKPTTCHFGAGQVEYFTMYQSFFENYDNDNLAQDLRERRSISSIVITANQVAEHWEISKQPEPTGATTSAELCSADKVVVKAVDVRHFSTSTGGPIYEPTIIHEDNTGTFNAVSSY